jgi:hypothetical protein
MCLLINPNQEQNNRDLKKWFGNRQIFAYVYKVLAKKPGKDFYRSIFKQNYIWDFRKNKEYQVNRPSKPTKEELNLEEVHYGFHVYTTLEEAKRHCYDRIIVKFRVRRKNIVAIENYYCNKDHNFKELVCRRLEFVKIVK